MSDREINVTVGGKALELLENYAESRGVSVLEAHKRAFMLLSLLYEEDTKGRSIGILEESDGYLKIVAKLTGI